MSGNRSNTMRAAHRGGGTRTEIEVIIFDRHQPCQLVDIQGKHDPADRVAGHCSAKGGCIIPGRGSDHDTKTASLLRAAIDVIACHAGDYEIATGCFGPCVQHQFGKGAASGAAAMVEPVVRHNTIGAASENELDIAIASEPIVRHLEPRA